MSDRVVSDRRKHGRNNERRQRVTSNIFSAFTQQEIQEFKEAFNMIDQNHDGFIDAEDLVDMMTSLGATNVSDDEVAKMLNDAPGPVNFTMFLTMFSERLQSTDPGEVLLNAFRMFDEQATGYVNEDRLRHILTAFGNRWTDEMVDELYHSPYLLDSRGFNYVEFVRRIKGYVAMDEKGTELRKGEIEMIADALSSSIRRSSLKGALMESSSQLAKKTNYSEYSHARTAQLSSATMQQSSSRATSKSSTEQIREIKVEKVVEPAVITSLPVTTTNEKSLPAIKTVASSFRTDQTSESGRLDSATHNNPISIPIQAVTDEKSPAKARVSVSFEPTKSIAAMRQDFFSSNSSTSTSTTTTAPASLPPLKQLQSSFATTDTANSKHYESSPRQPDKAAETTQTYIPILLTSGRKQSTADGQLNSNVPTGQNVVISIASASSYSPKTSSSVEASSSIIKQSEQAVNKTVEFSSSSQNNDVATTTGTPTLSNKAPWRQQQTTSSSGAGNKPSGGNASDNTKNKINEESQSPLPAKSLGSHGYLAENKQQKSQAQPSGAVDNNKNNANQQGQSVTVMLMQENPLSKQTPAFGYRMVPSPGGAGEAVRSFAQIVLNNNAAANNNNSNSGSSRIMSMSTHESRSVTNTGRVPTLPPLSRLRSGDNSRPNDAASRIMSASVAAISSTSSGARPYPGTRRPSNEPTTGMRRLSGAPSSGFSDF